VNSKGIRTSLFFFNLTRVFHICNLCCRLYDDLRAFPSYYVADPDLYSLEDLIQLRFGTGLPLKVKEIVGRGVQHVLQCPVSPPQNHSLSLNTFLNLTWVTFWMLQLCQQLGFHCEICKSPEVLFPFQLNRVSRCPRCSTCFHHRCFTPGLHKCPKCLRVVFRKQSLGSSSEYLNELPV